MRVDLKGLGSRLRRARQSAGLTVKNLAFNAHVSASYLSDVERGVKHPSLPVAAALAAALGQSLDWLVFGEKAQKQEVDLRALLREPGLRVTYGGRRLSEWDKERLVELIDAAWALGRGSTVAFPTGGAEPRTAEAGPGVNPYPGVGPALAEWVRRAVADALSDYWGEPTSGTGRKSSSRLPTEPPSASS